MLAVQGMLPAVPVGILGELVPFQWEMALAILSLKGIGAWELGCCSTASVILHSIPSIGAEMTTGRIPLLEEQNLCGLRAFLEHCLHYTAVDGGTTALGRATRQPELSSLITSLMAFPLLIS